MSASPTPLSASLPPAGGAFGAGAVLRSAARIVARNGHVLLPLAFVLALPGAASRLGWTLAGPVAGWGQRVVDLLLVPLQMVVLVAAAIPASEGRPATLHGLRARGAAALGWALCAAAVPVVLAALPAAGILKDLQPFGVVIVQVVLFVAVPVALVERGAGAGAFARSFRLTAGHRWSIVAVLLGIALVVWVPMLATADLRRLPSGIALPAHAALFGVASALHAAASVSAYRLLTCPDANRELATVFE